MVVDLNKIEVINLSVPAIEGLYINTHYEPTGQYELWIQLPETIYRSGWIKCSEEPTKEFLQLWLNKAGIATC
ncbi:hypothetical protein UFOVP901_3 [uncultured Caudovirales phage]|uniref:Uncharacterized protein n=1 Tax=uncultured Caudovirales phage TaxID=2100421 RepID=A0A6J5PEE2_9CAUD|nr:hypothetical protein UFOVP901_3 [uncultured Caudovirales phage]